MCEIVDRGATDSGLLLNTELLGSLRQTVLVNKLYP